MVIDAVPSEVLFATTNQGKLREVRGVLEPAGCKVLSLSDRAAVLGTPLPPEVEETLDTYQGNAAKKGLEIAAWSGCLTLADDTGLEVAALGGAPGVRSARFAGDGASMEQNRTKLLRELSGATDRRAQFVCVLVLVSGSTILRMATGVLQGSIVDSPRGQAGFGYDVLFEVAGTGRTLAELKAEGMQSGKFVGTHRVAALRNLWGGLTS